MGHYAGEMGRDELSEREKQTNNLLKKLGNMPLSKFTVNELGALMRITGNHQYGSNEEDLILLQKKLKKK